VEAMHYLSENNLSIKRDILEQLLKAQKLLIQFENEIRLHSVDREMMEIVEARHKTKILTLEQKISQLEVDYKKSQDQISDLL
jgi:septal ring factor EnvC (AmiA/AmiB activator)